MCYWWFNFEECVNYLTALHLLYLPVAAWEGFIALHETKKVTIRHTPSNRVIIGFNFRQNYNKQHQAAMKTQCLTTAKTSYMYSVNQMENYVNVKTKHESENINKALCLLFQARLLVSEFSSSAHAPQSTFTAISGCILC